MVQRAHHADAAGPYAVAHREQLVMTVHAERDVLSDTSSTGFYRVPRMRNTVLDRDIRHPGRGNERDRAVGIQLQKGVKVSVHVVHPVERRKTHPQDVREVFDLCLHVSRHDGEVVDPVRFNHGR